MEFKSSDENFEENVRFTDTLDRYFDKESTGAREDSSAAARMDESAERILRISAEENRQRHLKLKGKLREEADRDFGQKASIEEEARMAFQAASGAAFAAEPAEGTESFTPEERSDPFETEERKESLPEKQKPKDPSDGDAKPESGNGRKVSDGLRKSREEEKERSWTELTPREREEELSKVEPYGPFDRGKQSVKKEQPPEIKSDNLFSDSQTFSGFRADTGFTNPDHFKDNTSKIKKIKAEDAKELKKGAGKLALSKVFRAKKNLTNELSGNHSVSGDAMEDGKQGLTGSVLEALNPVSFIKNMGFSFGLMAMPTFTFLGHLLAVVLVIVMFLTAVMTPINQASGAVAEFLSLYFPSGGAYTDSALSTAEIDAILNSITGTDSQKQCVRFALERIGYPYSQDNRESGWAYDCSSYAYYAWRAGGKDLSFGDGYAPTAAGEASELSSHGKTVSTAIGFSMEPGDLIFYGGSDNGRFMGIYHVAIYVGNGMAAEALGDEWGVVYQPVRTNKVCLICRP